MAWFQPSIEQLARREMPAGLVPVRELENNDSAETSQALAGPIGFSVAGRVSTVADRDSFSISAAAGTRVTLEAKPARWAGRPADVFAPRLTVYAPDGSVIASAATAGTGRERGASYAFFAAAGGVYRMEVAGRQGLPGIGRLTGDYTLQIRGTAPAATPPIVAPAEAPVLTRLAIYEPTSAAPSVGDWQPVTAADQRLTGKNVYVMVHGWAVDYAGVPARNGTSTNPLKWWQTIDYQALTPASSVLTEPVAAYMFMGQKGENLLQTPVSPAGLAWQVRQSDPDAVILAYSWVDDSATLLPGDSEARTTLNGARLATGLAQVLPTADGVPRGVHLIGHSHGSKVATVAATLLRQQGRVVNQLTILDAPEQGSSVTTFNAANHLWYFLAALPVDRGQAAGTTFVDNYVSDLDRRLGLIQGYDPFSRTPVKVNTLQQVADVTLNPRPLLPLIPKPADSFPHRYAPAWYAGGSGSWLANPTPTVANQWSPLVVNPAVTRPVAGSSTQSWQTAIGPQFALTAGASPNTPVFDPQPTTLMMRPTGIPSRHNPPFDGTVALSGNGQGEMVTKSYTFRTPTLTASDSFGISFNYQFSAFEADDQLRITVNTGAGSEQKEVFVMTAKQLGTSQGIATLSLGSLYNHPGAFGSKRIEFSIVPSAGSQARTTVNITNFKRFAVPGA